MAARNISGLPTQRRSAILRFPTLAMPHGVSTLSVSMAQQQRFQQRSPAQLLVLACPASYWHLVAFSAGGGGGGNSHQPSAKHFQQSSSNGSDLSKRKFRLVYRSEDIEGSLPALIPTSTQFRYCVTVTGVEIGFESGSAPPAGYGVSRNGLREPGGNPLKLTPRQ
jgi:hypothetical protein